MRDYSEDYRKKLRTPDEIAELLESGMVCATGSAFSEPRALTAAFGRAVRRRGLEHIIHHQCLASFPSAFFDPELDGRYNAVSWFSSAYGRSAVARGQAEIMPGYFRDFPRLYADNVDIDVFYALVSPMDRHGCFSFGVTCAEIPAQLEKARHVFLEVNPTVPRTFGPCQIHISQVTLLCESETPLGEAPPVPPDPVSEAIGGYIAEDVPNGATIQLGVGAVPDCVGRLLRDKHDLGIHTELFTDSMAELMECGAVTNRRKELHRGKSIAALAMGSRQLYDLLDDNPSVEFHPVDYVNDPAIIARHNNFISVNACIEVDLWGQVASESIGTRHYSGTGGQRDFVRGAICSSGGKSFLVTPSTAKGGSISCITSALAPGAIVSTGKNDVDRVVTEYGVATLRGKTARQRAKALIAIAHPDHRDRLNFEAQKNGIL